MDLPERRNCMQLLQQDPKHDLLNSIHQQTSAPTLSSLEQRWQLNTGVRNLPGKKWPAMKLDSKDIFATTHQHIPSHRTSDFLDDKPNKADTGLLEGDSKTKLFSTSFTTPISQATRTSKFGLHRICASSWDDFSTPISERYL